MISPNASERRAEALERRLARVRADEKKSAIETVMARRDRNEGNGAPPELSITAEISAIGELLYGDRWTTGLALDLGVNPREVRRWKSGADQPEERDLRVARSIARRRAKAILHLVGPGD
ncbi:hypothetical protein [Methylobacterium aquaticum]|uniref:Uncharacterized protein n=1 Tax=Methylobacterium aquaticum TaxID=270351 RepID=A0A0C6FUF7_9HYPH|nr:hypothetical protein [Methylobacterium aquaticum]BAQ49184.1 hypothetical protein Maq22A_1p34605 [Methylobacterium aquaticum]